MTDSSDRTAVFLPIEEALQDFAANSENNGSPELATSLMPQREAQRLFHGRGGEHPGLNWLTIDAYWPTILITVFREPVEGFSEWLERHLISWCEGQKALGFVRILIQYRYQPGCPLECFWGEPIVEQYAHRLGAKFHIRFDRQNTGFFLDIEAGRRWLTQHCEGKRVLNLFSYTCVFSVVAAMAGANCVVNVDMSKSALTTGRHNHLVNDVDTANISFMPLNILKSWSRIVKGGPYDVVVIDPPSFQKGSFDAKRDYSKLVRRLSSFVSPNAEILACLNAPELDAEFIVKCFAEGAPQANLAATLPLLGRFADNLSNSALKMLHFRMP